MSTALYRHFDAQGRLLYVGISLSVVRRLAEHAQQSAWAVDIRSVSVERFATRQEALAAERNAIEREGPLFNVAHTKARQSGGSSSQPPAASPLKRTQLLRDGFAVLDEKTGRWDGWYFSAELAAEMLEYHRSNWPDHTFTLVEWDRQHLLTGARKVPPRSSEDDLLLALRAEADL